MIDNENYYARQHAAAVARAEAALDDDAAWDALPLRASNEPHDDKGGWHEQYIG